MTNYYILLPLLPLLTPITRRCAQVSWCATKFLDCADRIRRQLHYLRFRQNLDILDTFRRVLNERYLVVFRHGFGRSALRLPWWGGSSARRFSLACQRTFLASQSVKVPCEATSCSSSSRACSASRSSSSASGWDMRCGWQADQGCRSLFLDMMQTCPQKWPVHYGHCLPTEDAEYCLKTSNLSK